MEYVYIVVFNDDNDGSFSIKKVFRTAESADSFATGYNKHSSKGCYCYVTTQLVED